MDKSHDSKLVNFSLSSDQHPDKLQFENVWVVKNLNVKTYKIPNPIPKQWSHLEDIPFKQIEAEV